MGRTIRRLSGLGIALASLASLFLIVGLREAASRPVERRLTLALPGWPSGARPVTIALLSDIHLGNQAMDSGRLSGIVGQVNAARPDLVLLAGDFVTGHDGAGAARRAAGLEAPLSRLNAPLGVVAVLGNHDHWTAPDAVRAALVRAGITVLANEAARRGPLAILGVDDSFSGHDDVSATIASWKTMGGIPLVLTHAPDLVHKLPGGLPLVLAGHTHCGQVVLPGLGPVLTRSPRQGWRPLYDRRYRCGVVRDPDRIVVVTAGVGSGTSPVRLGAPPDWWLLRIGPAAATRNPPSP
ncbi:MAG: metallophosphoesterase [Alphaproteobacteria bacterium]|nr:metallophosphoesterase [Alphaproteobacteria bacterium]MBV9373332.1 metallophosphoesterase [Alphaproteobacteria bacterium]MBV9902558.1 metallophosphoesterase [Alphaproteobacteria bacterium]